MGWLKEGRINTYRKKERGKKKQEDYKRNIGSAYRSSRR
jgi:hypothetical protein